MTQLEKQLIYYNNLESQGKMIIHAFISAISFGHTSELSRFLPDKPKITQKAIKEILGEAKLQNIVTIENTYWGTKKYFIDIDFMLSIIRISSELNTFLKKSDTDYRSSYLYGGDEILVRRAIRDFAQELLYNENISKDVMATIEKNSSLILEISMFDYPEYQSQINKLDFSFIEMIFKTKISDMVSNMEHIDKIKEYSAFYSDLLNEENKKKFSGVGINFDVYEGKFETIASRDITSLSQRILGVRHLYQDEVSIALKYFDSELKLLRKKYKGIHAMPNNQINYFYFVTLFRINSDEAVKRSKQILNSYGKHEISNLDAYFCVPLYSILNQKEEFEHAKKYYFDSLHEAYKLDGVIMLALAYLADITPDKKYESEIVGLIREAVDSGINIVTYEAAYAANEWFNTVETARLYKIMEERLRYPPLSSNIKRHEDWEKTLSLLFNAVGGRKSANRNEKSAENSARIIYLFNPRSGYIQPILQSRTAKGGWTKGRNIAMKSLMEGKTKNMTDQDYRISKTIKQYGGGYYNPVSYEFSSRALVELIGHPYIFLAEDRSIPVEFVAAQPTFSVTKKGKNYTLNSDVLDVPERVFYVKETNTRYKIYDLNPRTVSFISLLAENKVSVPEEGKERLVLLLGEIGKFATVQSDLLEKDSLSQTNIKTVEPDNRIRVQLLPFGDGLKAELFAKPFGDYPPYSKPGLGGKMLITNVDGKQLQVKRDLKTESSYSNILLHAIQEIESVNINDDGLISFDDPLDSLNLLDVLAAHKDIHVVEWPEGERFKIRAKADFQQLHLRIKSKNNWFELSGDLQVDEETILSIQELMKLFEKSHGRFIELEEGQFLALSAELRRRLQELYSFSTVDKKNLQINKFASTALGGLFDQTENLKSDKVWKDFKKKITQSMQQETPVPETLTAELRPYQEEGFRWMARIAEWEGGACLADDMGLGKTIQTLAILLHRAKLGSALVVCPVSVVNNWISEATRFAPGLSFKTLSNSNRKQTINDLSTNDVLVTSYGLLQSEEKLFAAKEFATVVLDEAHIIKNYTTKTSRATMKLNAGFRLALTGTPLQNHLGEIWNIFNFINPGLLGNLNHFTDTFIKPEDEFSRKLLKKLIQPFILRRTKSAVLDELPPKTEIVRKVQLSSNEMAFYEALRRQALLNLESNDINKQFQVLAEITKLRQASCNPKLVDADVGIESSKMAAFLEIVDELIENKHRALVFSQFVSHLALVRQELDKRGISYKYLDGSTSMAERERNVKEFQVGDAKLFLISLKAGGLGLNLTAADYVIHLDPWWNPAIEDQASDRAHRIGQKRPVTIYRLVAENTIEEKIIELHKTKRNLAEALLEGSDQSAKLSYKELLALLQENLGSVS